MTRIYINDFAVMSRLGMDRAETLASLISPAPPRPDTPFALNGGGQTQVAKLPGDIPETLPGRTRTNRVASLLLQQFTDPVATVRAQNPADRIGVVVGTSTAGIEEGYHALDFRLQQDKWPDDFRFADQELGDLSAHIQSVTGVAGPCYTVSTACTSATKAIISAMRMIRAGIADAVICGGVDTLSGLTVNGFHALSSVSADTCSPYGAGRDGINIGEGGALFILSREPSDWALLGGAETSDAHHISSPDPEGVQAEHAIRSAIEEAGLTPEDLDFVHMHGTGTELNDLAEGQVISRVFGLAKPAMSTKGMTGHTLGAAGAIQLAINLISMEHGVYPPHVFNGDMDPALPPIQLTGVQQKASQRLDTSLCASYAFGGSNAALVAGRAH